MGSWLTKACADVVHRVEYRDIHWVEPFLQEWDGNTKTLNSTLYSVARGPAGRAVPVSSPSVVSYR